MTNLEVMNLEVMVAVTNLERWLRDCELYDIIEVVNQVYALGGGQRNVRSRTSLKRPQGGSDVAGRSPEHKTASRLCGIYSDCIPNS